MASKFIAQAFKRALNTPGGRTTSLGLRSTRFAASISSSRGQTSSSHLTRRADVLRIGCNCFSTTRRRSDIEKTKYSISDMDIKTYQLVSDRAMDNLTEYLEELVEDSPPEAEYDVEYSSGVLTFKVGDKGTYVINKQPPNKQIWLSSPSSGPKRYDYDMKHGVWFYNRDGSLLKDLLDTELREAMGNPAIDIRLTNEEE